MKKLLTAALALCLAATLLASCGAGNGKQDDVTTDETTASNETTRAPLPDYAGKKPSDFDADGNFILTSTDVRKVYKYNDTGYVVFTFSGETVYEIQRVLTFESTEAAQQYMTDTALNAVNNGEVPPVMEINGSLVILKVGHSADEDELGSYYTKTKTEVLADYPENKQL